MGEMVNVQASHMPVRSIDRAAFEELYRTYLPKVYNYVCYRLGDVTAAEDVTAEIFERAFTTLPSYRADRGAFSTWLFTIAHNLVANYLCARKRRPADLSLEAVPVLAAGAGSPEQATAEAEQRRQIQLCI